MSLKKTLQQYAMEAELADSKEPWACPRCGCRDLRGETNSEIQSTRHPIKDAVVRRRRVCRHCGQHAIRTEEVPVPDGFKVVVIPIADDE